MTVVLRSRRVVADSVITSKGTGRAPGLGPAIVGSVLSLLKFQVPLFVGGSAFESTFFIDHQRIVAVEGDSVVGPARGGMVGVCPQVAQHWRLRWPVLRHLRASQVGIS
jgi:hypothetical protein